MISVEGLLLRYSDKPLFDDISLRVNGGQRVALAGRNGQGKSTLMKVIAGHIHPERGSVDLAKGRKIGYLPQDIKPPENDRTVLEEALSGLGDVVRLEEELRHLTEEIAARPEDMEVLERYGAAQAAFEAQDGYAAEARTKEVLAGLGFEPRQVDGPVRNLSGGWMMRTQLARLLLMKPDVLLLDEPTNHLDIESKEWLLDFLQRYEGALMLTSHDRHFLDQLVDKVFEIESGRLDVYTGNYSNYEVQKKERHEQLRSSFEKQQSYFDAQQEFIAKNRYNAKTAARAQSRIKQLDRIERIELPPEAPSVRLRFPEPPSSGQVMCRMHDLGKAYGDHRVFSGLDLELEAGQRLAVVGKNGAGKTTLLKLLSGKDQATEGKFTLGHNVSIQYFSQYEDDLPPASWNLLEALAVVSPNSTTQGHLRTVLGCFLFSGDDAEKKIGVLSGGERARMKLARMLMKPSNLLVLDEPTNHLDLHSKDLLLHALQHFGGTSVFVSHDRGFLGALATQVLEIKDGRAVLYPVGYEQYRWRIAQDAKLAAEQRAAAAKGGKAPPPPKPVSEATQKRQDDRDKEKDKRKLQKKIEELEARLAKEEARKVELEAKMADPSFFADKDKSTPAVREHKALEVKIAAGWKELEEAMAALDA